MANNGFKAGQYYACKYNGDNGDLIVGCVKSVRRNGDVILDNLLSGGRSVKSAEVLAKRNVRVTRPQAALIVHTFKSEGKPAARKLAVELTAQEPPKVPEVVRTSREKTIEVIRLTLDSLCQNLERLQELVKVLE